MQDELQCKYTGGTVLHLYMNERISSSEACKNFVKTVLSNFKLPYITVTPVFSVCPVHGYLNGEHEYCPKCDALIIESQKKYLMKTKTNEVSENNQHLRTKCLVYTRVMGYHRPVESFNIGKKGEHKQRVHFKENQC
jgi:ribonucleoside-triphosphate reductase